MSQDKAWRFCGPHSSPWYIDADINEYENRLMIGKNLYDIATYTTRLLNVIIFLIS